MIGRSNTLKSARLRSRHKKIFVWKISLVLLCLVMIWTGTSWTFNRSAIVIQKFEIFGTEDVLSSDIASTAEKLLLGEYLFTIPRSSIFFYPKRNIESTILKEYPRVEKVSIGFSNFHTISISIKERGTGALWCNLLKVETGLSIEKELDDCYLLDRNGYIFEKLDPSKSSTSEVLKMMLSSHYPSVIKFYGGVTGENIIGQSYGTSVEFDAKLSFASRLEEIGLIPLLFRERSDGAEEVMLVGGTRLIFLPKAGFDTILANLLTVITDPDFGGINKADKVDYFDLRFGSKVIYRSK
ncbi:MAG: hypothetical protein EXS59_01440 [Candidatus Taylorbacteria bacterium]|nr:hypothetical protein [Candidatus Taylorbacteria bacterium]